MLEISVTFLHGVFRGSSEDVAITGQPDPGEWPPSPARLFAALVAADGTRDRMRVTDGSELRFLEELPPPIIEADPPDDVPGSPIRERYVVLNKTARQSVQEYVARKATAARQGTRRSPRNPTVRYIWPDAELPAETLAALERRAMRVGYLGGADSPVVVSVAGEGRPSAAPERAWIPDESGTHPVAVPFAGLTDVLDAMYDAFSEGQVPRRTWYRIERAMYWAPAEVSVWDRGGTYFWLRIRPSVPGRRVRWVTQAFRRAVLSLYPDPIPAELTGHGFEGKGFQHAHWMALPDAGGPHSRGSILGLALWLPPGTSKDVLARTAAVFSQLREVWGPGVGRVSAEPASEDAPWSVRGIRWMRPARRFTSVFPVVWERRYREGPGLEDVAEWCEHAGFPAPSWFAVHEAPEVTGGLRLHASEVFSQDEDRRRFTHMTIEFPRPVSGPVVLGKKRQFGLGLFTQVADGDG